MQSFIGLVCVLLQIHCLPHSAERAQESIIYSYTKHINGFAAMLEEKDIEQIKRMYSVLNPLLCFKAITLL